MRYILFLIILFSAISGLNEITAQNKKILIDEGNASVKQIFNEIEKQTFYTIGYNEADIDINKKINVSALSYNLDELLKFILKDTDLRYTFRENHILLVPQNRTDSRTKENKYNGKVLSADDSAPLPYATIMLKDNDKIIAIAVTDDNGEYSISTPFLPTDIQVSFIGFETINRKIGVNNKQPEIFYLKRSSVGLGEARISANTIKQDVDRTTYLITNEMRESATHAFELLDKIPKLRVDRANNTVKTGNDGTVLLLVDGLQQSEDYIRNISSERVLKMEIVHEPSGRFVAENYSVIVNYILKKDYTGYDINAANSALFNPAGTNGNDWLMSEQPEIDLTYTKDNFSVYAHYDYKKTNLNLSHYRFVRSGDFSPEYVRTENTSLDNPSDIYSNRKNHVVAGINYYIKPNHILSFQNDYIFSDESTENRYQISKNPESLPVDVIYNDTTTTKLKDKDYKGTVSYKGFINDNIQLYSDISYNRYSDDVDNYYRQQLTFKERNIFKEHKNQLAFNMEGNFRITPSLSLNAGYSNNWREYGSNSSAGEQFIDYNEFRNKIFAYTVFNLSPQFQAKICASIEHIRTKSINYRNSQFIFQPHVQVNYVPDNDINVNMSYMTNSDNPTLSQLSIMPLTLDTIVNQIGNPELKTSVNHVFSARFSYKDRLYFKAGYIYSPDALCETIEKINKRIYNTFDNIKIQEYSFQLDYIQPFLNDFNLKSSLIYYFDKAEYNGINNKVDGWIIDAAIDYYNREKEFGLQVGYRKGMSKKIMWQGYKMINNDKWEITAKKHLLNKQLSVMLSYIPPIDWGVRYKQERNIETSIFEEKSYLNMKTFRNTLFLKIQFRFNKGKVRKNTEQYKNEDKRRLNF